MHLPTNMAITINGQLQAGDALLKCPMAISPNGNHFAVSSLDGQLHIWDTVSSHLVADYTPSAHLSATCVRLSWPPLMVTNQNVPSSPSKKRKRLKTSDQLDVQSEVEKLSLVALGTADGSILLYSVTKAELHTRFNGGHTDRVNDIAWHASTDSLFSCSSDKHVIEWSISKSAVKSKHMLDRSVINAICVIDNHNILTASNSVKWWNWNTKTVLKTFNGHSTEVRFLKPIITAPLDEEPSFVVSSAASDRYINVWELNNESNSNSNSINAFALDDEPISLELAYNSTNQLNSVYILSISRTGFLYIFEHQFFAITNGNSNGVSTQPNTPIMPKLKLQISCSSLSGVKRNKHNKAACKQLPFLCAHLASDALPTPNKKNENHFTNGLDRNNSNIFLLVGYGNVNRPTFERITYADCVQCYQKAGGVLHRTLEDGSQTKPEVVNQNSNCTKIRSKQSKHDEEKCTVIGPAGIAPVCQPTFNNIFGKTASKKKSLPNSDDDDDDEDNESDDVELSSMDEDDEKLNNFEMNNNHIGSKSSSTKHKQKSESKNSQTRKDGDGDGVKSTNQSELSLAEKLAQISELERVKAERKEKRKRKLSETQQIIQANTDSLVNVLTQGLQSNDETMLQTVLNCTDELVVGNTIKKLPVSHIPALMNELQRGLFKNGDHQSVYLKWISNVIKIKIAHLMTMPDLLSDLLPLNQLLTARTSILDRCYQLKGRLDVMLAQTKQNNRTSKLTRTKPLFTYESDTSDSEGDIDADEMDEDGSEVENDILSMDDHELMNDSEEDDDDIDDDEMVDEEMYDSANEDGQVRGVQKNIKKRASDLEADSEDSDEDEDEE